VVSQAPEGDLPIICSVLNTFNNRTYVFKVKLHKITWDNFAPNFKCLLASCIYCNNTDLFKRLEGTGKQTLRRYAKAKLKQQDVNALAAFSLFYYLSFFSLFFYFVLFFPLSSSCSFSHSPMFSVFPLFCLSFSFVSVFLALLFFALLICYVSLFSCLFPIYNRLPLIHSFFTLSLSVYLVWLLFKRFFLVLCKLL
jgi:hypothetical protein